MSNIIVNGDFLNNYNNWTKTGLYYDIKVGQGAVSGNSLYMGAGFDDQQDIIYQNITLIPGLTYALRFYYKTQSSPPSNDLLKVSILGINTNLPPVLSYTLYETTFVANNANAVLTFTSQNVNSANFLSNISVVNKNVVCFKEDTKILTKNGYKLIQDLRKGDLVKTLKHDYKAIDMIGKSEIYHSALQERIHNQLYKCSQSKYPEIFEPLIITGHHSILVNEFVSDEQREKTSKELGNIYITDDKYRLPVCLDERASVYETPGNYTIYHVALENDNYYMNYGIYANGLLVETCSKRYLKELSNMSLIE